MTNSKSEAGSSRGPSPPAPAMDVFKRKKVLLRARYHPYTHSASFKTRSPAPSLATLR